MGVIDRPTQKNEQRTLEFSGRAWADPCLPPTAHIWRKTGSAEAGGWLRSLTPALALVCIGLKISVVQRTFDLWHDFVTSQEQCMSFLRLVTDNACLPLWTTECNRMYLTNQEEQACLWKARHCAGANSNLYSSGCEGWSIEGQTENATLAATRSGNTSFFRWFTITMVKITYSGHAGISVRWWLGMFLWFDFLVFFWQFGQFYWWANCQNNDFSILTIFIGQYVILVIWQDWAIFVQNAIFC